ncbi:MAG TPA: PhoH family protein [Acidimicrobiia bacterium]|nr:PhoH family protein [Acidimicrobiia bacterium]
MTQASLTEVTLRLPSDHHTLALLGERDAHIRLIEEAFPDARIVARGDEVRLSGTEVAVRAARIVIEELVALVTAGHALGEEGVRRSIKLVVADAARPTEVFGDGVAVGRGKVIRPKTLNQKHYVDAIRRNTVVFGIGPAGTGKTYLGMALAVAALHAGSVNRLVLTRPAVEAGERLGFLPGDMAAKVDPYLRPLYDALYEMLGPEETHRLMDRGTIEVAPLAYMRGRTINDAFIVLDEAQNTSPEQMKMFLTRLGFNSKMVITGDVTQVDLPAGKASGLRQVRDILADLPEVAFVTLTAEDVVRNRIVATIVEAYRRHEEQPAER